MNPGALRALESDRVVDVVASLALTPMGRERLSRLEPSSDAQRVSDSLAATTETVRYLASNALFPFRAPVELLDVFSALGVEGRPLEPLRLFTLAAFLDSVDETRAGIRRAAGAYPALAAAAGGSASFQRESGQVREKIEPSGDVVDHASPELKLIR